MEARKGPNLGREAFSAYLDSPDAGAAERWQLRVMGQIHWEHEPDVETFVRIRAVLASMGQKPPNS